MTLVSPLAPPWSEQDAAGIHSWGHPDRLIAVGWYRTICTLCNGLALPVEGWMRRWPASAD